MAWIVTMILVLIFGGSYLLVLYFKFRWQLLDVLLMTIGGSILPAMFAQSIRESREPAMHVVAGVAVLFVVSQLIIVPMTQAAIDMSERLKITSTFKRAALIVYAWSLMPAIMMLMFAGVGIVASPYPLPCIAILCVSVLILMPARRLMREAAKATQAANSAPPTQAS